MLQNWCHSFFKLVGFWTIFLIIGTVAQQPPGPGQGGPPPSPAGPRPYAIPPQIAAKLQQQQHLQQLQHQQQQQQQQQQLHAQAQFQATQTQRSLPPQPQQKPAQAQIPKYVATRNNLEPDTYQKRYSPAASAPKQQGVKQQPQKQALSQEEEEDYYEDELPDKLALLLAKSKFECSAKKDGYYADETLNCEVFHYCQDAKKHSWMCPENMNFHQVHLICMPPSQDNICTKSANFHFVNDYLYRPINEKEAASTNSSLKYADRYYPQGYTPGMSIDEIQDQQPYQPRAPQRFGQNVFYNPESVNIPLTQRRPPSRTEQRDRHQSNEYYDE